MIWKLTKVKSDANYHSNITLVYAWPLKITKPLAFHLSFKTADLQDFIYTTLGRDITVAIDKFYLYVSTFIPDPATRRTFNDSIKNSLTLSFHSWFTDRKLIETGLEYQLVIAASQDVKPPKKLLAAHQTAARMEVPNKANNIARFDNLDVRKTFVKIDGVRYPKETVSVN